MKRTTLFTNYIRHSLGRFASLLILLLIGCFGLLSKAQAVNPPPDGGYAGGNTAEGQDALLSLTTGRDNTAMGLSALSDNRDGGFNTAVGAQALFHNTTGNFNTATGFFALRSNTAGNYNTANGSGALALNTQGGSNTATGVEALFHNTTAFNNTATGGLALFNNTEGNGNTANGYQALYSNTTASANTATGDRALFGNTTGYDNTAYGYQALYSNTTGLGNTAVGLGALSNNTTGGGNIALGTTAGENLTTEYYNIDIGAPGVAGESNTIRIGYASQYAAYIAGIYGVSEGGIIAALYINSNGQLGTQPPSSSRRFKKEIKPMAETSEAILALKPVTFHYKSDEANKPEFGLIAEEVTEVNPDLVVRDKEGKPYSVRYDAVNAMLLNEFLKEHRRVEEQAVTIANLKLAIAQQRNDFETTAAQQHKQIEALTAGLQKVSTQLEMSKPAPQIVGNNQ